MADAPVATIEPTGTMEDAIAILNAPNDAPAPAEPAAPTPTPEAPAAPADAPPPPVGDPTDKLLADLEARRAARQQRQPQVDPTIAQLQRELAELKALQAQSQPGTADFAALVREHGEVEALRKVGIDPIAYFNGFRERAKQVDPRISATERAALEAQAKAAELEKRLNETQQSYEQREAARHQYETERAYMRTVSDPELGLSDLAKLTHAELMDFTAKAMEDLKTTKGYTRIDFEEMTDRELAAATQKYFRGYISRFTGNAGATNDPKTVPATDGAKTTPAKTPVSLTNDLASQFTGGRKLEDLNDRESWSAAMSVLNSGAE